MAEQLTGLRRALISVSDKTGLNDLVAALRARNVELISTGGTARAIRDAGHPCRDVSEITEFPEMMDGRVKTLHPRIHGGLLAVRSNQAHSAAQARHGILDIDLLVVNLYPFEKTVAGGGDFAACVENIDIGGPAMIRAAAKNHEFVTVVVAPDDYRALVAELDAHDGATTLSFRRRLAARAYARTGSYDAAISQWFQGETGEETPAFVAIGGTLAQPLRYGENPHQTAAFYRTGEHRPGVATARQVQGKELSYNNINDTDAAFECVCEFDPADHAAIAIIKHANPCGVALGHDLASAWARALKCDPQSAFGGIVAANRALDGAAARAISEIFTEVVIAPDADDEALEVLAGKKNLRVLLTGGMADPAATGSTFRSVSGGFLLQSRDAGRIDAQALKVVTKRTPTDDELRDLLFAFQVCKHVKSNAIIYARNTATVGIGAGQMSRIDSARIAALKSRDAADAANEKAPLCEGSVVASDAFFPFADGLLAAAGAGATAVIQPGGSMRDDEVIQACDENGLAMVFTGMRHFRH